MRTGKVRPVVTTKSRLNASSAPWRLCDELKRKGWGVLSQGWKSTTAILAELCARADYKTGRVVATYGQISDATRYSTRSIQRAMAILVPLGLIELDRGGIAAGKPVPSTFRVVKARLWELVDPARATYADLLDRRAAARQIRETQYRLRWTTKRRRAGPKTRRQATKRLVSPCGHGDGPSLPTEVDRPPEPGPAGLSPAGAAARAAAHAIAKAARYRGTPP